MGLHKFYAFHWVLTSILMGFCFSSCLASVSSRQERSGLMGDVPGAISLPLRHELQQRSTFGGRCTDGGRLSKEMRTFFSLVKKARNTARKNSKSTEAFMYALQSPQDVFLSTQMLLKELRGVLRTMTDYEHTEELVQIRNQFAVWYETVQKAISPIKSIDIEPASFWLRTVQVNLTQQKEAFERLRTGICNASGYDRDDVKFNDLVIALLGRFGREMVRLEASWNRNKDLLKNASTAALNLQSAMAPARETVSELQTFRAREVTRRVNRQFKRLAKFLEARTQFSRELHELLAAHIGGNWIEAMEKSGYSGFLSTLSSSKKKILKGIMQKLRNCIEDLKKATKRLPTLIYRIIDGDLNYSDSNGTGSSPTLGITNKLKHSLRVLMRKKKTIPNEEDFVDRLIIQMEAATKRQ